jgi:8-oxo-dGTP diphosphatase
VQGDGNGWTTCDLGHRHWGRHGAAGLLLHAVDNDSRVRVLLQHRAAWSHFGGTWGLPGGARDSHENAAATALREAVEETSLDAGLVRVRGEFVDDHGRWTYTTVYADTPERLRVTPNRESAELDWVVLDGVTDRPLHPGFAATWQAVRARSVTLLVDVANVVGTRPDGWWRDRAGASSRLLGRMDRLRAVTMWGPEGEAWVIGSVVAVLEGEARSAKDPQWVRVMRTRSGDGSGDDLIVAAAASRDLGPGLVVAVTADRGLRGRLEALGDGAPAAATRWVGPGWLLEGLDQIVGAARSQ